MSKIEGRRKNKCNGEGGNAFTGNDGYGGRFFEPQIYTDGH